MIRSKVVDVGQCFCGKSGEDVLRIWHHCGGVDGSEHFLESEWDQGQIVDNKDLVQRVRILVGYRGHGCDEDKYTIFVHYP